MNPFSRFVSAFLALAAASLAIGAERPNFVIFFTDDQGYNDVGCYGSPLIRTPHFDRLAREGTRLTSFYVQPVCGVSRAALMTGCYPIRVAEPGNTKAGHPVLHPDEVTMAEVLKTGGYRTGLIGKWHLAGSGQGQRGRGTGPYDPKLMPNAQGFDYFYGTPAHNGFTRQADSRSWITELMRNEEVLESPTDLNQITRKYTDEAVRFIQRNKNRPFLLYLAHNMPHVPLGASEAFRGKSRRGLYGDAIEELDDSLGQVLAALQEAGVENQTLVIFTSDNGPWVEQQLAGDGGTDAHYGSADPLRGFKMTTWEGGVRVPCIVRWPGRVPAGRVCDELLTSLDLLPTFARLAGVKLPEDRTLDGHNIWDVLSGVSGARNPRQTFFYYCYNHLQAVRHGKWKLVLPRPAKPRWCSWSARMVDAVPERELYDLKADLGEASNVASENPEVVAELQALIEKARVELGDFNRIGSGARFFDEGPRRPDTRPWVGSDAQGRPLPADGGGPYPRSFAYQTAIGHEPGVTRRDPSDVIRVDGTYHVWYSKVVDGPDVWGYPSGYSADVFHATSRDGKQWTEQGRALGKGESGTWDAHGVFTPNILFFAGKYYLYYTGVPRPFDKDTKTAIGVAVAEAPDGPWSKVSGNPVLAAGSDPESFDSMRVDDASLVIRDGLVWLYYKGRQLNRTPGQTKMGVATARSPEGPYVKHPANPLHAGHEVLVWPQGTGVASLATAAGPKQVYFAADGVRFEPRNSVRNAPRAPGCFRIDDFRGKATGRGITWGISHASRGRDLYLVRFDGRYIGVGVPQNRRGGPQPIPYDNVPPVGDLRFDFETGDLQGWRVVEGQLGLVVSDRASLPAWKRVPFNKQGKFHLSTVEQPRNRADDALTGVVESPRFVIAGKAASCLIGGGDSPTTYVALCTADGTEVLRAGGTNSPVLRRVRWDVSPWIGQEVYLRVVDRKTRSWGHITFDDFSVDGKLAVP